MDDLKRFQDVVEKYAKAYADFESIQKAGKDRISFVPKKGEEKTVQVKTVSEFSEKKIISHILPGFKILYLVKLNKNLFPEKVLKVTTKGDWPDIRHKAFPKDKFSYKDCIFQTFDETEDFIKVLQLKSN